jgi:threonine synthase
MGRDDNIKHRPALPDFTWRCYGCGAASPLDDVLHCPVCNTPRSIEAQTLPPATLMDVPPKSMWSYYPLLPIANEASIVTLDEGATPLVPAPATALAHGVGEVWLKLESANPTGSFKDRQVSVGISHAREIGADTVAVVSSGNVAAAASAYAARAGDMQAVLFMHGQASADKIKQAALYGATVIQVDDPSPAAVFKLCIEACDTFGWYHLSTAGIYTPYNVEGAKSIAYELYQQFDGDLPEWIVMPVGGGGLLGGVWRGFLDLQRMGLLETLPRIAGVQAAGCAPLKQAIDNNWDLATSLAHPWPNPHSIAGGIADDILFDGHTALPAIRETGGVALAVTDEELLAALHALARREGVLAECCSAVTLAALKLLPDCNEDTRVCCVITGNGIKDIAKLETGAAATRKISPSLAAIEAALCAKR